MNNLKTERKKVSFDTMQRIIDLMSLHKLIKDKKLELASFNGAYRIKDGVKLNKKNIQTIYSGIKNDYQRLINMSIGDEAYLVTKSKEDDTTIIGANDPGGTVPDSLMQLYLKTKELLEYFKRAEELERIFKDSNLDKHIKYNINIGNSHSNVITFKHIHFVGLENVSNTNNSWESLFIKFFNFFNVVSVDNCDASNIVFTLKDFMKLTVNNSTVGSIKINKELSSIDLIIHNSYINHIVLYVKDGHSLEIISSTIKHFEIYLTTMANAVGGFKNDLIRKLVFSKDSVIEHNKRIAYTTLQRLSRSIGDTIQEHIFYVKALEAFRYGSESSTDDKWLLTINHWFNSNGTSFLKPIFWLFFLNAMYIIIIYCYTNQPNNFLWHIVNVNPVNKLDISGSNFISAIDALRRITITMFIFLTTTAALRFRFKKC